MNFPKSKLESRQAYGWMDKTEPITCKNVFCNNEVRDMEDLCPECLAAYNDWALSIQGEER
jgi:hypothetical protein